MHTALRRPLVAALLLIGILALHSCTRPEQNIGLGIQPEEDLLGAEIIDTITVSASTIVLDSLRTDDLLFTLLGSYVDPDLGQAIVDMYTQIRLSSNDVDFGNSDFIYVDSLVLAFEHGGFHHGNTRPMNFMVQEIDDEYIQDSTYYNHHALSVFTSDLMDPNRRLVTPNYTDWVVVGEDSLPPQLRLHLDTNFAREKFLSQSGLEPFSNNESFLDYFKGFKISPITPDRGVFSFNLLDANSSLTMYYRDLNGDEPDTTSFVFNINDLCSRHYQTNFSRSNAIAGINATDTLEANPYVYAQGGANVAARVEFPFIKKLLEIPGMVINKAELIIPVKEGAERNDLPSQIYLRRPIDDATALLPEELIPNFNAGGTYDAVNKEYRVHVGRFLEHVLIGDIEKPELWIMIEDRYALANTFVDPSLNRLVLHGPSVDPNESSSNMRLILTHTSVGE
jgi:hypothetical protein